MAPVLIVETEIIRDYRRRCKVYEKTFNCYSRMHARINSAK